MIKKILKWTSIIVILGVIFNILVFNWGISLHEDKRKKSAIYSYELQYRDAKIKYDVLQHSLEVTREETGKKIENLDDHEYRFYRIDQTLKDIDIYKKRMERSKEKLLDLGVKVDSL